MKRDKNAAAAGKGGASQLKTNTVSSAAFAGMIDLNHCSLGMRACSTRRRKAFSARLVSRLSSPPRRLPSKFYISYSGCSPPLLGDAAQSVCNRARMCTSNAGKFWRSFKLICFGLHLRLSTHAENKHPKSTFDSCFPGAK
jgi:hypothetical protein